MSNVTIDGVEYTPKVSAESGYSMVRTYSAGVFAGKIKTREGKEATLTDARRIWKWVGAASLSELAIKGTAKPDECKFPVAVPEVTLTEVIEIGDGDG